MAGIVEVVNITTRWLTVLVNDYYWLLLYLLYEYYNHLHVTIVVFWIDMPIKALSHL